MKIFTPRFVGGKWKEWYGFIWNLVEKVPYLKVMCLPEHGIT